MDRRHPGASRACGRAAMWKHAALWTRHRRALVRTRGRSKDSVPRDPARSRCDPEPSPRSRPDTPAEWELRASPPVRVSSCRRRRILAAKRCRRPQGGQAKPDPDQSSNYRLTRGRVQDWSNGCPLLNSPIWDQDVSLRSPSVHPQGRAHRVARPTARRPDSRGRHGVDRRWRDRRAR